MQMLSGEKLGAAITVAMELKGVGPKDVADHFGIKPPSVKDWQKRGCVHKRHLGNLVSFFSDVVPPSHWGADPQELSAFTSFQDAENLRNADVKLATSELTHIAAPQAVIAPFTHGINAANNPYPMAPILEWARLGVDLYRANKEWPASDLRAVPTTREVSDTVKWVPVIDDALAPKIQPGDLIAIDPQGTPARDEVALFQATDGSFMLRRWRPLPGGGFEAVDSSGHAMDSQRHGLRCVGSFAGLFRDKV
jgi:hypothetical protein